MDIDIVVLGRAILVLALLGAWAGWRMAGRCDLNRFKVSIIALLLGLLPPLNALYLFHLRGKASRPGP